MARQRPANRQDPLEDYSVSPAGAATSSALRYFSPNSLRLDLFFHRPQLVLVVILPEQSSGTLKGKRNG